MNIDQKEGTLTSSYFKSVLYGLIAGAVLCALILTLFSIIMHFADLPLYLIAPFSIFSSVAGAFGAGFAAARISGSNGMLVGAITGFMLFVIVLIVGLTVLKDSVSWLTVIKLAAIVLSGAVGGIAGVNVKARKRR